MTVVGKISFANHDTTDAVDVFGDSVLVCKINDCYYTIRKNFGHFHSFLPGLLEIQLFKLKCQI